MIFKRIKAIMCSLALLTSVLSVFSVNVSADKELAVTDPDAIEWSTSEPGKIVINGIKYWHYPNISADEVGATAVKSDETELNVLESIGGLPVKSFSMYNIDNVERVYIPKTIEKIGDTRNCYNMKECVVDKDNNNYCSVDGVLYSKDMKTLLFYPPAKSDKTFRIPDGVENVGLDLSDINNPDYAEMYAFYSCENLKNLIFPNSVKEICSVYNCGIEYLKLPDSEFSIKNAAFSDNKKLKEVVIPEKLLYCGSNSFTGCDSLTSAVFLRTEPFKDNYRHYPSFLSSYALEDYPDSFAYGMIFGSLFYNNLDHDIDIYVPDRCYENYDYAIGDIDNYHLKPLSEKPKGENGDINGNGRIEVFDVLDTQNYLIGTRSAEGLDMDVNNDDTVNVIDLIVTERMVNAESE